MYRTNKFTVIASFIGFFITPMTVHANTDEFFELLDKLSFEDLLDVTITTASGLEERMRDAPAAMVVINAQDIKNRGYTSLEEVMIDLPGFDTVVTQSTNTIVSYQRGYRTPFTQRTLLMVNGNVENDLWNHRATMGQQYPLSNIERIEVLYGPVSAVYGPNAFLGVVNIITKDPKAFANGDEEYIKTIVQGGSYRTKNVEVAGGGSEGQLGYNFSAKIATSDGPEIGDFGQPWGFVDNAWYNNRDVWGPILDQKISNIKPNHYASPVNSWGLEGRLNIGNLTAGMIAWDQSAGYGAYYAADKAQALADFHLASKEFYTKYEKEVNNTLKVTSLALYRESRVYGNFIEATPDWHAGKENFSYVSISNWSAINSSWLFKQDYDFKISETFRITGGIKFERKQLTKAYDVCGYWEPNSFCSNSDSTNLGPDGFGPGVIHSSAATYDIQPSPLTEMPSQNLIYTTDEGIYVQGIWNVDNYRFNAGVRYDDNSHYGQSINPRASAIYHFSDKGTVKLLYGTAFQEPAPIQLFGGWNGRKANPDLKPEEAENLELVWMYRTDHFLHDASLFVAHYENVLKEEAENAGQRDVQGFEYRGRFSFDNIFSNSTKITGNFYYSYAKTTSSIHYDFTAKAWVDGETELGDIAPHKINASMNVPIGSSWNVNLSANMVSDRTLYSRNPLRTNDRKAESYVTFDMNLRYNYKPFSVALKVKNLFDEAYFHPGAEQADSGDDFSKRSLGFRNSLIPQLKRNFMLMFETEI